jgi:peptide subunit release factor 1 (eRF1)
LQQPVVMAKTSPALATPLRDQLDKLAALAPQETPVLSLYLNLTADQHGRDNYETFIKKALPERRRAFREGTPERESFDRDVKRIQDCLSDEVNRSANGLAIFACAGAALFDVIQLQAPLDEHWLFVDRVPHLYPLASLVDRYPRYAAVVLDTNSARIAVFSLGAVEQTRDIANVKTRRTTMGGWSQARYQRHTENLHLHHVKEVVDVLDKIVSSDNLQHLVIAGDAVVVPMVKDQLPQRLLDKLVDTINLDHRAPEHELLQTTLATLREHDAEGDAQAVADVVGAWQGSALGVVGPEATLHALELGQVDQLLITGSPDTLKPVQTLLADTAPGEVAASTSSPTGPGNESRLKLATELVKRAHQTGARVRFIEDDERLREFGGVAAALRFRI